MTNSDIAGVLGLLESVKKFELSAHHLFAIHEESPSRIVTLNATLARLDRLSLAQEEMLRQALQCVELGIFRAGYVLAWAAFIDYLEEKLTSAGLAAIHSKRPKWVKWTTLDELRENVPEYQLIEVAREARLLSKADSKALLGDLSRRNECAHPSSFHPNLNEALGYISGLITRIEYLSELESH